MAYSENSRKLGSVLLQRSIGVSAPLLPSCHASTSALWGSTTDSLPANRKALSLLRPLPFVVLAVLLCCASAAMLAPPCSRANLRYPRSAATSSCLPLPDIRIPIPDSLLLPGSPAFPLRSAPSSSRCPLVTCHSSKVLLDPPLSCPAPFQASAALPLLLPSYASWAALVGSTMFRPGSLLPTFSAQLSLSAAAIVFFMLIIRVRARDPIFSPLPADIQPL